MISVIYRLTVYQEFRQWGIGTCLGASVNIITVYQEFRQWGIGTLAGAAPGVG